MKLIEIVNSIEALNKLAETKLPAFVGFNLGKFIKEVNPDIETYNKVKMEKAKEYGTPVIDKDGKELDQVTFMQDGKLTENGQKFVDEMSAIEQKELDIKVPDIKIADLGTAVIEPKYLLVLSWLIK